MNNKYSVNPKLNKALCGIEGQLLDMCDSKKESINQILAYVKDFKKEPDCNIAQHGNLLIYFYDIKEFYKNCGYKSTGRMSDSKIWDLYKQHVGRVARCLVTGYYERRLNALKNYYRNDIKQ